MWSSVTLVRQSYFCLFTCAIVSFYSELSLPFSIVCLKRVTGHRRHSIQQTLLSFSNQFFHLTDFLFYQLENCVFSIHSYTKWGQPCNKHESQFPVCHFHAIRMANVIVSFLTLPESKLLLVRDGRCLKLHDVFWLTIISLKKKLELPLCCCMNPKLTGMEIKRGTRGWQSGTHLTKKLSYY